MTASTEAMQHAAAGKCPIDHSKFDLAQPRVLAPTGCPVSKQAAEFDPFEGPYQVNPPESLRWSRDGEPVFYSPKLGYWVVTRYDDVKAIFRDNRTYSPSIALEKITPVSDEATEVLKSYDFALSRTLVNEDEPAHMPRRRALMEPFTPSALAEHEPMVRRLTREAVDKFVDAGKADLVNEMLYEIPLTVAMHFLGVPEDDMDTLRAYSVAHTVNTWGRPKPEEQVAVAHAVGNFWQYAGKILEKMRQDPSGPGWMQYGIRMQKELPEVVTDSYLHSMMMAGIVAAHETTAHASANAMRLLLENREVWEEICADPSLIPNAVEECLRYSGSVAAWRRLVTEDTEVGGVPIPKGSKLLIVNSSANHDERHFDNPDDVDLRRDNASDHLTFGYGSHQCMGKNLARMEIQIFLEELTKRLPHMELVPDQEFTYLPNTSFRGPEHVLVQWDPARNPERLDPSILGVTQPVRIGEPSKKNISRTMVVREVTQEAEGVVRLTLADASGRPLPKWAPGAHVDIDCGDVSRQYSLCGNPDDDTYDIAVLREAESRGGSRFIHDSVRVGDSLKMRGP
ncbi:MAG TPA: cytochrome P450, partial [Actinomycetales bacterium]|nr:cytochrome P450 [Actinomycetales bacterium]